MDSHGSVTHWIAQIQLGDAEATQAIWQRYFPPLVRQARAQLRDAPRRFSDEEDVAASVMESLFRAAENGRFPNLADRNDLWRLILRMTARKVVDLKRHELRERRGGGRVQYESPKGHHGDSGNGVDLAQAVGREPTPDFAIAMAEECQRLLSELNDPVLTRLALAKMEGSSNEEIAQELDCSVRTVERRLRLIRKVWESETNA